MAANLNVQLGNADAISKKWEQAWASVTKLRGEDALCRHMLSTGLFDWVDAVPVPAAWSQLLSPKERAHLFTATRSQEQYLIAVYQLTWSSEKERQQFQKDAEAKGAHVTWASYGIMVEVACISTGLPGHASSSLSAPAGTLTHGTGCNYTSSPRCSDSNSSFRQNAILHEELIQSMDDRWRQALEIEDDMQPHFLGLSGTVWQPRQHTHLAGWSEASMLHWGLSAAFRSLFPSGPPPTPMPFAAGLSIHYQPLVPHVPGSHQTPDSFAAPIAELRQYYTFHVPLQQHMPRLLERARQQVIRALEQQLSTQLKQRVRRCFSMAQRRAEAAAVCLLAHMVMFDAPKTVGPSVGRLDDPS